VCIVWIQLTTQYAYTTRLLGVIFGMLLAAPFRGCTFGVRTFYSIFILTCYSVLLKIKEIARRLPGFPQGCCWWATWMFGLSKGNTK